jgi:hypothetical protein
MHYGSYLGVLQKAFKSLLSGMTLKPRGMIFSNNRKMKTMLNRIFTSALLSVSLLLMITACKKENSKGTTDLRVNLTDNPFNATEVNVDIREVRVKFVDDNNDDEGWISLDTRQGIYNLLDFQNGIDTTIAQAVVPTDYLREIRFVLGADNSITINNVNYPLTIPSGSESGLKIKLNKQLNAHLDSLTIDFDAALSIFQEGTGDYTLKPVLKIK